MNGKLHKIILSFGGNEKETEHCFELALEFLTHKLGRLSVTSSLYSSEAWGMENSPDFLNKVVIYETELSPTKVLKLTQNIENQIGRKEKSINNNYKDRPIDIDILFYENQIVNSPELTIPHYLVHKRKFILLPLCEIIPDFTHPVFKKSIKQLLLESNDKLVVSKISK